MDQGSIYISLLGWRVHIQYTIPPLPEATHQGANFLYGEYKQFSFFSLLSSGPYHSTTNNSYSFIPSLGARYLEEHPRWKKRRDKKGVVVERQQSIKIIFIAALPLDVPLGGMETYTVLYDTSYIQIKLPNHSTPSSGGEVNTFTNKSRHMLSFFLEGTRHGSRTPWNRSSPTAPPVFDERGVHFRATLYSGGEPEKGDSTQPKPEGLLDLCSFWPGMDVTRKPYKWKSLPSSSMWMEGGQTGTRRQRQASQGRLSETAARDHVAKMWGKTPIAELEWLIIRHSTTITKIIIDTVKDEYGQLWPLGNPFQHDQQFVLRDMRRIIRKGMMLIIIFSIGHLLYDLREGIDHHVTTIATVILDDLRPSFLPLISSSMWVVTRG